MNATELVTYLRNQGVVFRAEDKTLKVDAPAALLTPELRQALAREKAAILKLLARTRKAAQAAWKAAMRDMASAWGDYAARCQATGQEPAWVEDDDLTAKVGTAIRAGDFPGTRAAIADWREAWSAIMGPECRFDTSPAGEPGPVLLADARRLSALGLNAWLVDADLESRAAARRELHARADQVLDEAHGLRPPPNASVHAMFCEVRRRFGYQDLEARSVTAWLRRHAPDVAARWPGAPLQAAWIDWRRHVGPEDIPILDRAFEETRVKPEAPGAPRRPKAMKQKKRTAPGAFTAGPLSPGTRRGEEP